MTSKIMRNYLKYCSFGFLLLMLSTFTFAMSNNDANELFGKGNNHYAKGQYTEAVKSYQQILEEGYKSAEVYFNLGNAFYKLGEMAPAILYYEKAYKMTPGDDEISLNLQLANLKIADKIEVVPEFFLTKWWRSFSLYYSAHTLSVTSGLLVLFGFVFLVIYLFAMSLSIKKPSFYAGITLIALGLIAIFILNVQDGYLNSSSQAIIFNGTVNVKSGPNDKLKTLFVIHEGTKVTIRQDDDNWIKVELPNGSMGWILSAAVKQI